MTKETIASYKKLFEAELFENVLPYWSRNLVDKEYGGLLTSLDRKGEVYSDDKSVWFQGRGLWTYSNLCNVYGVRQEWLDTAKSALDFARKHCFDADGRMFFIVAKDGRPLRKRRYYFSETFFIIGLAEYSLASGDQAALNDAIELYDFILGIYNDPNSDPFKITPKNWGDTRPAIAFANPMILLNVTSVLRRCDPQNTEKYDAVAKSLANDILTKFYKPDLRCVLETVGPNGEFYSNFPGGRTVNPGHSIEGAWFVLNEARLSGDKDAAQKALNIIDWALDIGWDKEYGGIYAFVDALGKPCEQLEYDMKLWWPHTEAIYATLLAYDITGEKKYSEWFGKLTEYAFGHFRDKECGEWYGYLHRDGTVSHTQKGSNFKGPFHLPRMLISVHQLLTEMEQK